VIICNKPGIVGSWVMERCEGEWYPGRGSTMGLLDSNGSLVAGIVFESYNGSHLFVHAACLPGGLNEEFLHACFHYCFVENHCSRISCVVEESNETCHRFVQRVGWTKDVVIEGAGFEGRSLIVYKMTPQECKWLTEDERNGR
jgi:RimJ/RimL family protein N-acetyltransferase